MGPTEFIHVYPDGEGHILDQQGDCFCEPKMQHENGVILVLHSARHTCKSLDEDIYADSD